MAGLTRDDLAQIEAFRATATPEEAGKFAAELYKLRNTPGSGTFGGFPRWLVVCIAVWLALLETSDKLPQLLLSYPRYQAALAEVQAKIIQPDLLKAQVTKAENDAAASQFQSALAKVQLDKAGYDATVSRYAADAAPVQPALTQAQLEKAKNDAATSAIQPDLTSVQLAKARLETLAAAYQPKLAETQLQKNVIETRVAAVNLPSAELGAALSNAILGVATPAISGIMGGLGNSLGIPAAPAPAQANPAPQPSPAPEPSAPARPAPSTQASAPRAAAPNKLALAEPPKPQIIGQPVWLNENVTSLISMAGRAWAQRDCTTANGYLEGVEAYVKANQRPDDGKGITSEQRAQYDKYMSVYYPVRSAMNHVRGAETCAR